MESLLAQAILLARKRDADQWMQVLVFVVIAAVYAVGAILKAKSAKREQEEQQGGLGSQSKARPRVRSIQKQMPMSRAQAARPVQAKQNQPFARPQPRIIPRPRPTPEKPLAPAVRGHLGRPKMQEVPGIPPLIMLEEPLEPIAEPSLKPVFRKPSAHAEAPPPVYISELLADSPDIDELRKAILYYEILGRPVSLRKSSQDIIGL